MLHKAPGREVEPCKFYHPRVEVCLIAATTATTSRTTSGDPWQAWPAATQELTRREPLKMSLQLYCSRCLDQVN